MSDSIGTGPAVPPFQGDYVPKLFTIADLQQLPSELPSGPVRYELHHGRLITMPPPGDIHGAVETKFAGALLYQGEFAGHGKARCGEVSIILSRNPDHVVGADAVFISNGRLPIRRSPEGYLETIPDLVVEIRSKNDSLPAMERKATDYLNAGSVLVWVVDPINRNVLEYRHGIATRTWTETETLAVDDIIPGFRLPVSAALAE
jgi:Uma2 family endonuclease